ncbi:hypothetical protein GRF29_103g1507093 [Pseudopithomyces chartarum]|uniref:Metallo-beta-lactamase domain-containing protein n=1 Tax=Pseudopithomyces chartarum TaxID=1892770 RepID=A0AAN6LYF9_9PLEO|nr:hypothetical protein GRF29_103g1507093 [Pseudopithomyces chartarum]
MTSPPPSHPWHPIPPSPTNSTCTVHLLQAGTLRIPYALTLLPTSSPFPTTHFPVPDYCFLITHPATQSTYLFDLAMRLDLHNLPPSIVKNTLPNFPASPKNPATVLRKYGSREQQPEKVKAIIFSHTHFDHVGDGGKGDFPGAELWLGATGFTQGSGEDRETAVDAGRDACGARGRGGYDLEGEGVRGEGGDLGDGGA